MSSVHREIPINDDIVSTLHRESMLFIFYDKGRLVRMNHSLFTLRPRSRLEQTSRRKNIVFVDRCRWGTFPFRLFWGESDDTIDKGWVRIRVEVCWECLIYQQWQSSRPELFYINWYRSRLCFNTSVRRNTILTRYTSDQNYVHEAQDSSKQRETR